MDLFPCRQWARAVNSNSTSGPFSCLAPRWPDRRASGALAEENPRAVPVWTGSGRDAGILGRPLRQTFTGGRVVVSPGVLSLPPQAKCGGSRNATAALRHSMPRTISTTTLRPGRRQLRLRSRLLRAPHRRLQRHSRHWQADHQAVPSEGLVGIEGGVVSGVFNLESPGVRAPGRRPRHDQRYHEA